MCAYQLDGIVLKPVSSYVDLGIKITSDLSWSCHITSICKKAKSTLSLFSKIFTHPSPATFIKVYTLYVRPILEYGDSVWSVEYVRDRNMLESVQRYATRIPYGRTHPPYEARLRISKLTTSEDRRHRADLIFCFRVLHNQFTVELSHLFSLNTDTRLRRHRFKLKKETYRTRHRQYFLPNRIFNA
ncbi:hypothetical protein Zmor_005444 [Zophobas morio]|uniref:Uncharacterized protein n=1 Tax=Zophobas morio TaxID=2755281 RepID=A0AA38IPN7_9CUCU|nr:hypothetical protein Zmor_005444 [Zophobas morio]